MTTGLVLLLVPEAVTSHAMPVIPLALPTSVFQTLESNDLWPLVSPVTHDSVVELAKECPLSCRGVGYEVRLAEHSNQVDFALCLLRASAVDVVSSVNTLREARRSDPHWHAPLAFLDGWLFDAGSALASIPFVWLAFDLCRQDALPIPCISVCVDKHFFARRRGTIAPNPSPVEVENLANVCHNALYYEELPLDCRESLRVHLSALAAPRHLSFMLGRPQAPCKLDVRLSVGEVATFLGAIAWPAPPDAVAAAIREFVASDQQVQLNLVLNSKVDNTLQVEFFTASGEAGARLAFLRNLVKDGLCSREKAQALETAWRYPILRGKNGRSLARNWYAKVRFEAAHPVDAKAYISLMPRP